MWLDSKDVVLECDDVVMGWVCGDLVHMKWAACLIRTHLPIIYAQGGPFLAQTRNTMVDSFLSQYPNKQYLMMVDTDIQFTNKDILRLREHEGDVVSGTYMISGDPLKVCAGSWDTGAIISAPAGMKKEVDYVGAGFMMIDRKVFEKIGLGWFDYMYSPDEGKEHIQIGEDLSFCHRVQDAGFSITLDTTVQLGHIKNTIIRP